VGNISDADLRSVVSVIVVRLASQKPIGLVVLIIKPKVVTPCRTIEIILVVLLSCRRACKTDPLAIMKI
jgi:hypothetical protein